MGEQGVPRRALAADAPTFARRRRDSSVLPTSAPRLQGHTDNWSTGQQGSGTRRTDKRGQVAAKRAIIRPNQPRRSAERADLRWGPHAKLRSRMAKAGARWSRAISKPKAAGKALPARNTNNPMRDAFCHAGVKLTVHISSGKPPPPPPQGSCMWRAASWAPCVLPPAPTSWFEVAGRSWLNAKLPLTAEEDRLPPQMTFAAPAAPPPRRSRLGAAWTRCPHCGRP